MFTMPRVIAIDDSGNDLDLLVRALRMIPIACLPVKFDPTETIPPCPSVRIIFFDLHLCTGMSSEPTQDFNTIVTLLENSIKPSGPYFIVLWTEFPGRANELHKFIRTRLSQVKKPFTVRAISKQDYLNKQNAESLLKQFIVKVVSEQVPIAALLNWEERVLEATANTISDLLEISNSADNQNNASDLLAVLASEAVGEEHARQNPFRAVNEALLPILSDHIGCLEKDDASLQIWKKATLGNEDLTSEQAQELNRLLHVQLPPEINKGYERGVAIPLPQSFREDGQEEDGQAMLFYIPEISMAKEEFKLNLETTNSLQWVLIQVQAACDYAQNRSGAIPYNLGVLAQQSQLSKNRKGKEAVWESPCFRFDGNPCRLLVHSRFHAMLSRECAGEVGPILRLREQMLNSLIYHVHNYSARPGIMSFEGK